jgi:hypothetical protein
MNDLSHERGRVLHSLARNSFAVPMLLIPIFNPQDLQPYTNQPGRSSTSLRAILSPMKRSILELYRSFRLEFPWRNKSESGRLPEWEEAGAEGCSAVKLAEQREHHGPRRHSAAASVGEGARGLDPPGKAHSHLLMVRRRDLWGLVRGTPVLEAVWRETLVSRFLKGSTNLASVGS